MVHQSSLDRTFAALADPVRREILARLRRGDEAVSVLAADHTMSLPAFMKHIRTLEDAGLVTTMKVGRVRRCQLCEPAAATAEAWLRTHLAFWHRQLDSLERLFNPKETLSWQNPPSPRIPSKSAASSPRRPRASTTRGRSRRS